METKNPESFVLNTFNWMEYASHTIVPPHSRGDGGSSFILEARPQC